MDVKKPVLVLPDLQMPYEHEKALQFASYVKRHYGIPDSNVINVGDECDAMHGGLYDKDPNAEHSAVNEIKVTREKIKEWASVFPEMRLCISNHGLRWLKKASLAQIPSMLMRRYEEVFEMPQGWKWQEEWRFMQFKHPFRMIHGMGYSGRQGHYNAVIDSGISTLIGHLHSHAGINYIKTMGAEKLLWGMNVGCLIDEDAVAFKYGKYNRQKPCLGLGMIFNNGSTPVWLPLDR